MRSTKAKSDEQLIPLNLIYSYPVNWNRFKVLRDFIQNFYDAVGREHWSTRFHQLHEDGALVMTGEDVGFSHEWLLHIGASTKRKEQGKYAGFFGEGFKIASLCALRDHGWQVSMSSRNWKIEVITMPLQVDGQELDTLAYRLKPRPMQKDTCLRLSPFSVEEHEIFEAAYLSFFHKQNPLLGKGIYDSDTVAVYLRSEVPKPSFFPSTFDYYGRGIVFAGYQAVGSLPLPIIICQHDHRFKDRERSSFYRMDVVSLINRVAYRLPPKKASALLELLRSRWYDLASKKYDFETWEGVISTLVERIAQSKQAAAAWCKKYPNLLHAKRIPSRNIIARNKRAQAMDWFRDQTGYKLVNPAFAELGYPSLEEACERAGGFSRTREPEEDELVYLHFLEKAAKTLFGHFFLELPPCRIIHTDGIWRGMASCLEMSRPKHTPSGHKVRFRLQFIALKEELLQKGRFGEALSTYLHEAAHMFGGDRSAAFSSAMTELLTTSIILSPLIEKFRREWDALEDEQE
jgi:hypothetical protein